MEPVLFLLVITALSIVTGNVIYSYRFKVYPVDRCPLNSTEFEAAARRRNCTGISRYLCAPDKNLTNPIEFCTDVPKSLYGKDNCVRLEGTGDLNHYNCLERFITGCPNTSYTDDNIYENPACLDINKDLHCFVAEKGCKERQEMTGNDGTLENTTGLLPIFPIE